MRHILLPFVQLACVPVLILALAFVLLAGSFDWLSNVCAKASDFLTDFVEDVAE